MSDYIPNPPNPDRDPRNSDRYYEANSGRGLTLVVGILVAIALVAGLMFFAGTPDQNEQAQAPQQQERGINPPASPGGSPGASPTTPRQ